MDLGAMSVFLYCFREREMVLDLFEMVSGHPMMSSYFRPGGLWRDITDDFIPTLQKFIDIFPAKADAHARLLTNNPLSVHRTQGLGGNTPDDATAWRGTGP